MRDGVTRLADLRQRDEAKAADARHCFAAGASLAAWASSQLLTSLERAELQLPVFVGANELACEIRYAATNRAADTAPTIRHIMPFSFHQRVVAHHNSNTAGTAAAAT